MLLLRLVGRVSPAELHACNVRVFVGPLNHLETQSLQTGPDMCEAVLRVCTCVQNMFELKRYTDADDDGGDAIESYWSL